MYWQYICIAHQAINRDKEKCLCFFSLSVTNNNNRKTSKLKTFFYLSLEKSEIENTMQNTLLITSKKINLEDY